MTEISIHIHEDDWSMRNLYPLAALSDAVVDVEEAAKESERNRAPNGMGWSRVHLIKRSSIDYSVTGLQIADAASALERIMPRVRKFTATATAGFDPRVRDPLGSYDQDAYCYGFDSRCFIRLDLEKDRVNHVLDLKLDRIKHIWFQCRTRDSEKLDALRGAILAIDSLAPSVIADYWDDSTGAVGDAGFLDLYFRRLKDGAR